MYEGLNQDLRQVYETTENDFNLRVQLAVKQGKSRTELIKSLKKASKKSVSLVTIVSESVKGIGLGGIVALTESMNKKLINSALKEFDSENVKIKRLVKTIPIKQAIFEQTQKGINADLKIRKGGRKWSYKSYMEMNTRTTVQQEVGDIQLKEGKGKIVFYICNVFADSADDHSKWQGKIYYDDRYASWGLDNEEKITKFIRSKKMKSVQWVKGKPVYLTTRPNCRHTLTPLSTQQAIGESVKKLIDDLKLKTGSYKPKNYEDLKQQRYNERNVRRYKARVESNEKLGYDTSADKIKVRQWQGKQRELMKKNPELERDYRRESNNVIINDLGAKINKKG